MSDVEQELTIEVARLERLVASEGRKRNEAEDAQYNDRQAHSKTMRDLSDIRRAHDAQQSARQAAEKRLRDHACPVTVCNHKRQFNELNRDVEMMTLERDALLLTLGIVMREDDR